MNLSGNSLDYLAAFFGGILISFTPCVYPLIPVSVTYIGAKSAGSKLKGFTLSLVYVTGVAVTYSILGLFASLTGKIFGAISSHPLAYLIAGAIIIAFGLSLSGLFFISLPRQVKLPQFKKQNYFSVFILGLFSGLIVGPCTTPVLGAILIYLTTKKNIFYGATLLFSFAYGMGLLLIMLGTFSSALSGLPKSGKWLKYIEKIGAVILITIGVYFIYAGIRRF